MNQQHDERTKKSRWPQWQQYKSSVFYGLAGSVLCIVMFLFAGLPLNPNLETFNTSTAFVRLIIIMFGIPFILCTVNTFALGDRYRKTHPNAADPPDLMTLSMVSTAMVCVFSILAKLILTFGFLGIIIFGFELGFVSGLWSRKTFNAAIQLKK
jgi:hypothetical protein